MICGNCKEDHASVAEVQECYRQPTLVRTDVLPAKTSPPPDFLGATLSEATEAQKRYIRGLIEDREDVPTYLIDRNLDDLTKTQASAIISELMELPEESKNFILGTAPEQGRFTVVFPEEGPSTTIRFHQPTMGRYAGRRIVQYLYGPDNTSDYRTVGTVSDNGATIFPNYLSNTRVIRGIKYLLGASKEERTRAGEIYSLAANNCWRCGRDLTREESITRGMGPICAKKEALI